jgi:hypothetical protein
LQPYSCACRQADCRRPPAAGAPWRSARARDHDRHRSGRGALSTGPRPWRRRSGASPLFVSDSAALRTPVEEPRSADPSRRPGQHQRLRSIQILLNRRSSCAPGTFRRPRCCNMSRASRHSISGREGIILSSSLAASRAWNSRGSHRTRTPCRDS